MERELEELLRHADAGAPRRFPSPPSAASLRRAERLRLARLGGLGLLALGAAWGPIARRLVGPGEAPAVPTVEAPALAAVATLDEALRAFEQSVELTSARHALASPLESARRDAERALQRGADSSFRALHTVASEGSPLALARMDDLARRFPSTHGGRCARAFLDAREPGALDAPRDLRTETPR